MRFFKRKDKLTEDLERVEKWLSPHKIKVHFMPHETHVPITIRACKNGKYEYTTIENNKLIGRTI